MQIRRPKGTNIELNNLLDRLLSENPDRVEEGISIRIPPTAPLQQSAYKHAINNLCNILSIDQAEREKDSLDIPNAYQLLKKYLIQVQINGLIDRKNHPKPLENNLLAAAKDPNQFEQIINHLQNYFSFGILEPLINLSSLENKFVTELSENIYQHLSDFLSPLYGKEKQEKLSILVTCLFDLAELLKTIENGDQYISICKIILNDLLTLIQNNNEFYLPLENKDTLQAALCLAMSNHFASFIESKIKPLSEPANAILLNLIRSGKKVSINKVEATALDASFIAQKLAQHTNISTDEVEELRGRTRASLIKLDDAIHDLQITFERQDPVGYTSATVSQCHALFKKFKAIKENILQEWCIYLTTNKSQTGEFGYINPFYYYFDLDKNLISKEIKFLKEYCYQELKNELLAALSKIKNELTIAKKKNIFKSPLTMRIKEILFGNQNNNENSENKISGSRFEIKNALNAITQRNLSQENFFPLVNKLICTYNEQLFGPAALGNKLATLKNFYSNQVAAIHSLLNRHHSIIDFFSSTHNCKNDQDPTLQEELFHIISIKKNYQLAQKTEKKCNSRLIRFLEALGYPNKNFELGDIQTILTSLKRTQPLSSADYLEKLNQLSISIDQLRQTNSSYIDRLRAKAIENLCYNMIETHCLNHKGQLSLNFTHNQLSHIRRIVFAIKKSNSNKRAANLSQQLMDRIQNLQDAPANSSRLLLSATKKDILALSVPHVSYLSKESIKIATFEKAFIHAMTSQTIGQYAISSGQLQTMPGAISNISALFGSVAVPFGACANGVAWMVDQQQSHQIAKNTVQNMLPLIQWMALIEEKFTPYFSKFFRMQIINMKNKTDIERFAEFCQKRMFAALKQGGKQDWAQGLTIERFLIAAVFKMQNKLSIIPFRTDHYHQENDASMFGNSSFQKMIGSVAFITDKPPADIQLPSLPTISDSTSDIYIGSRLMKQSKKVSKPHQAIKKSIKKYGVVDLINSTEFSSKLAGITARTNISSYPHSLSKVFHHTNQTLGDFFKEKRAEIQYRART